MRALGPPAGKPLSRVRVFLGEKVPILVREVELPHLLSLLPQKLSSRVGNCC